MLFESFQTENEDLKPLNPFDQNLSKVRAEAKADNNLDEDVTKVSMHHY